MTNNNGDEQCGSAKYALKASGDKDFCSSYRVYTPQLIDIHEMRTLREAINRSEQHLQQQGHMRVYVPRVSSTANKSHQYRSLPRNYQATSKLTISADSSPRMHSGFSPLPDIKKSPLGRPTRTGAKVSEFKTALRKESRQVRGYVTFLVFCYYDQTDISFCTRSRTKALLRRYKASAVGRTTLKS
ncbi:hypothetical protein Plhal703r1_c49g0152401 [Plasmopara halstedii]